MNKQMFSLKVAAVIQGYSALPVEAKAETLTNLKRIMRTVKSKRARAVLKQIEDYFKSELKTKNKSQTYGSHKNRIQKQTSRNAL